MNGFPQFVDEFSQAALRKRPWRVAAIAVAGLALAFGVVAYTDGNNQLSPISMNENSYIKDVPSFGDQAPSLWSELHYPRPGKSNPGILRESLLPEQR